MKDLFFSIYNIFKYVGKFITFFRNTLINIIFIVVLGVFLFSLLTTKEIIVEDNSALLLAISGNIVEEKQEADPFNEIINESLGISRLPEETLLQDLLDSIAVAANDPQIGSIILDMSKMKRSSFNHIHDIGQALLLFRDTGKTVVAAENFYTQNKYLLASYADKIFLNPMGAVDLHGLGLYRLYFNQAIEKLKINYHVFRVGAYKSALEPFTRNSMSNEAKIQNGLWLNELWQIYTESIIERRNLPPETIDLYTNNITIILEKSGGDTAQLAVDTNLVDELKSTEELRLYLNSLTGRDADEEFTHVTFKQYLKTIERSFTSSVDDKDAVGIIVAQGNILTGKRPPGAIGGESLTELIRQARQDSQIKAVVLRIDSGGGSVFASEMIRRELQELKKDGKPFVVSMGSMAASGGYWISAEADEIWAYPTTLTGSIGIFGAIPTFEESLSHMGIFSDGIGTTELSSGLNITRPLSQEVQDAVQLSIDFGYQKFLDIVRIGRELDPSSLKLVSEGRVFDGKTAMQLGLVDNLGNLDNAIEASAKLAHMEDYTTVYIKSPQSFSEKVLQQFNSGAKSVFSGLRLPDGIVDKLKPFIEPIKTITYFNDPKGAYAHCMIHFY